MVAKKKLHRKQLIHLRIDIHILQPLPLLHHDPRLPVVDLPVLKDLPLLSLYWGLSVLCAVRKAMPWVLKWVLRSEALSKRRPHTLQLRFPSPSSPSP